MSLVLAGCAVLVFSMLAFWKANAVLFMITAGCSLALGLQWFDVYTTNSGLTISLMLISYCFLCVGFAFRCIFWRDRLTE